MTVFHYIIGGAHTLALAGVESPRLQSELLLAHVLKTERLRLILESERPLLAEEEKTFAALIRRRAAREPLQHLLGSVCFCGCEITVSPAALIPRPETESLAELGWLFLKSLGRPGHFLDLGTGTGCLAIAIAAHVPTARGLAIDISPAALALAAANSVANDVAGRVECRAGDFLAALRPGERFDLILSNPPYIPGAEIETLEPEVREHDPRLALDGGADGLRFYRSLAREAAPFLREDGRLMVEFGDGQAPVLTGMFEAEGWKPVEIVKDLSGRDRFLTAGR